IRQRRAGRVSESGHTGAYFLCCSSRPRSTGSSRWSRWDSGTPVSLADPGEILRAPLLHTPRNPFLEPGALESYPDGALFLRAGKIAACGNYNEVRAVHPDAAYRDLRGGFLLPGMIDTHIHFP